MHASAIFIPNFVAAELLSLRFINNDDSLCFRTICRVTLERSIVFCKRKHANFNLIKSERLSNVCLELDLDLKEQFFIENFKPKEGREGVETNKKQQKYKRKSTGYIFMSFKQELRPLQKTAFLIRTSSDQKLELKLSWHFV